MSQPQIAHGSEASAPGSATPLGAVDAQEFERVWQVISEIGSMERHFNELESKYRTMAAGWMLAVFSAIGFVVSETLHVGGDRYLLVAVIAGAGLVGLVLLWILDLLVYHQLLDACFVEGLILEDRHAWLPPLRHGMMETQKGKGVLSRVVGFYVVPIMLFAVLSGGSIAASLWKKHEFAALASAAFGSVAAGALGWTVRARTENTAAVQRRLKAANTAPRRSRLHLHESAIGGPRRSPISQIILFFVRMTFDARGRWATTSSTTYVGAATALRRWAANASGGAGPREQGKVVDVGAWRLLCSRRPH